MSWTSVPLVMGPVILKRSVVEFMSWTSVPLVMGPVILKRSVVEFMSWTSVPLIVLSDLFDSQKLKINLSLPHQTPS